jgi:hypothetical protein
VEWLAPKPNFLRLLLFSLGGRHSHYIHDNTGKRKTSRVTFVSPGKCPPTRGKSLAWPPSSLPRDLRAPGHRRRGQSQREDRPLRRVQSHPRIIYMPPHILPPHILPPRGSNCGEIETFLLSLRVKVVAMRLLCSYYAVMMQLRRSTKDFFRFSGWERSQSLQALLKLPTGISSGLNKPREPLRK